MLFLAEDNQKNLRDKICKFVKDNNHSDKIKELANEVVNINYGLNEFNTLLESPTFNALETPWLKALREYAKRLEQLKDKIAKERWDDLNKYLDRLLTSALTKTAFKLNLDADQTKESNKEHAFKNDGKKGVGYLLYEFANGTGKDEKHFPFDYDITQQMLAGNVSNDIKVDFEAQLKDENLTFNQFVANGESLDGGYSFSPDHTGVVDSFNKHINANWVQFFTGGTKTTYYPSNEPGWIIVEMRNPTSRYSLLLHIGDEYKRDGSGNNKPLSTIEQVFKFKLKVR